MEKMIVKIVLFACALSLAIGSGSAQIREPFSEKGLPSDMGQPGSAGNGGKLFIFDEDGDEDDFDPPKTGDEDKNANSVPAGESMALLAALSIAYGIVKRKRLARRALPF